jgi:hypothetical protein
MNGRSIMLLALMACSAAPAPGQAVWPDKDEPSVRRTNEEDPYGYDHAPSYRPGRSTIPRYDRRTRDVSGRITGTTGAFGRKLRVLLDNGEERSIEALRSIAVRRYSRAISVHELRRGEEVRIRLDRYLPEGTLVAVRIEAFEGASRVPRDTTTNAYGRETTIRGSVKTIDSRGHILRLDVDYKRVIVHTDRADIRDERGSMTLRDLQSGDLVTVEGRRDGDDVYAVRVSVR